MNLSIGFNILISQSINIIALAVTIKSEKNEKKVDRTMRIFIKPFVNIFSYALNVKLLARLESQWFRFQFLPHRYTSSLHPVEAPCLN